MSDETETPDTPDGADPSRAPGDAAEAAAPTDAPSRSPEELAAEYEAMRDQMLRAAADAENVRKRAEKEVADTRAYAVTGFARDMLSVADNLARARDALTPELRAGMGEAGRTLLEGVELTERELHAALARHNVEPIPAEPGAPFDPNLHQAAAQIPSSQPAGAIVEEVQSGWRIGERVLRAAIVAVSAGGAAAPSSDPGGEPGGDAAADGAAGFGPGASVDTKI